MQNINIINAIETYQKKYEGKKIAIYPLGNRGRRVNAVLNENYGIEESIVVDNELTHTNPSIVSLEKVENYNEYIWLLACANPEYHKQIRISLQGMVSEEQIIDVFGNADIYSDEYRLLSKIGSGEKKSVSTPCRELLELITKKKNESRVITVAEVGVGLGATAVEACKCLTKEDTYICFDYEDVVDDLLYDLKKVPEICCKLAGWGNSRMIGDSYNWNLCNVLFQMRNENKRGVFDLVYLDGAHTLLHDGLACCILKELLKPKGYIIFDDMFWTHKLDEKRYKIGQTQYPEEQLADCQMLRVVNAFMLEDERFQQIYMTRAINPDRAVYMKVK